MNRRKISRDAADGDSGSARNPSTEAGQAPGGDPTPKTATAGEESSSNRPSTLERDNGFATGGLESVAPAKPARAGAAGEIGRA
jgi:hypothetical protein